MKPAEPMAMSVSTINIVRDETCSSLSGLIKKCCFTLLSFHSALQCVLKTHAFAASLCCRQKTLLELHSVSGQLCVEQATGPFSVCVHNSPSVHTHTHTHTFNHFSPSATLSLFDFLFISSALFLVFCLYFSFCSTHTAAVFLSLSSGPRRNAKLPEKGC